MIETLAHGYSSESTIISHRIGLHNTCQKGDQEIQGVMMKTTTAVRIAKCKNYHSSPYRPDIFCDQNFICFWSMHHFFFFNLRPARGRLSLLSAGAPTSYVLWETFTYESECFELFGESTSQNSVWRYLSYHMTYPLRWAQQFRDNLHFAHFFRQSLSLSEANHLISFPLGFSQL